MTNPFQTVSQNHGAQSVTWFWETVAGATYPRAGNRVTRLPSTRYAMQLYFGREHPKSPFASGRVEDPLLVHKNVARCATFLWTRKTTYHAAAGESGFHRIKRSVWATTASLVLLTGV